MNQNLAPGTSRRYALRLNTPDHPQLLELTAARTTIGGSTDNDIQLDHPTISTLHCVIEITEDGVWVEDLGSTNGTAIDGELVQRAVLRPGQRLQLGEVELTLTNGESAGRAPDDPEALGQLPPPAQTVSHTCAYHPQTTATWTCTQCGRSLCGACVRLVRLATQGAAAICLSCQGLCVRWKGEGSGPESKTFAAGLLQTLAYPVRGNGVFMLLGATLLYAAMDLISRFRVASLPLALIGLVVGAYMLTFFRQIILSSANGEDAVPPWPDFQKEALIEAIFHFICPCLVSFGPWMMARGLADPASQTMEWVGSGLLAFGVAYFPMALLAVVIYDSVAAINPVVVVLSIIKSPLRYFAALAPIAAGVALMLALEKVSTTIRLPVLGPAFLTFGWMYVIMTGARAMGWFYFCSKEKLSWC